MDDELELEIELELLVHEVTANLNTVQGRNTLPSEKNAIWQTITNIISTFNQAQTRMTGSGHPQSEPLTILEDVVQQTLVSEQVVVVEWVSIPRSPLLKVCMVWYPVVNLYGQITALLYAYIK